MRRSAQVVAPLLAAAAVGVMTGCREPQMQRCVDEQNHVVLDSFCQTPAQNQPGPNGVVPMYRYYYGGSGGWSIGSVVTGGGYTPVAGESYSTSTTRGGFGSSHGGGEGGGAGE